MLDPRICNIGHDANALDWNGSPRDTLVDRFRSLVSAGRLIVVVAGGVRDEIQHPRTPGDVKDAVLWGLATRTQGHGNSLKASAPRHFPLPSAVSTKRGLMCNTRCG